MNRLDYARRNRDSVIEPAECRAIRELDSVDYTRSELAFMFECQVPTIARHADRECHHRETERLASPYERYTEEELLAAIRDVFDHQPYRLMSQRVYEEHRDSDQPTATTIYRRFGSFTAARRRALGGDSE